MWIWLFASAREAFEKGEWRKLAPAKRKAVLLRWADLIEQHWEELAMLESLDTGKPIACTMDDDGGDVHSSIRTLRWTAECIDKLYGETTPHEQDTLGIVSREPVGVVAAIMPWNYLPGYNYVEAGALAGYRQLGGLEAGFVDAADRHQDCAAG